MPELMVDEVVVVVVVVTGAGVVGGSSDCECASTDCCCSARVSNSSSLASIDDSVEELPLPSTNSSRPSISAPRPTVPILSLPDSTTFVTVISHTTIISFGVIAVLVVNENVRSRTCATRLAGVGGFCLCCLLIIKYSTVTHCKPMEAILS